MRNYRWQLLALVIAAGLFFVVLLLRSTSSPTPTPDIPIPPTTEIPIATPTEIPPSPTAASVAIATPFPLPTAQSGVPTFTEALIGQVQRLNPVFANLNPVDRDITSLIFEGLVAIDEYGQPVPRLAKSWTVSSDGREYVFELRDDVLWQDGLPFTANDVAYTMAILRAPDFPGDEALGAFWRTVETEVIHDHLVRFRLTQPLASFLMQLTIGILPEHALQGTSASQLATHPFNLSPIGTGPYQLEALRTIDGTQIDAVDLRVAPVYRQRPEGQSGYSIDRMRFMLYPDFETALNAFNSGEVNGLAARNRDERKRLLAASNADIHTAIAPQVGVLIFNWDEGDKRFFQIERVRQALVTGLSRAPIVERNLANQAIPANSPLLPESWAYTPNIPWPQTDVNAARLMLGEANIQYGEPPQTPEEGDESTPVPTATPLPQGFIYSFNILVPDDDALVAIAQEIAAQWSQLGLEVRVEQAARDEYLQRLDDGLFDTAIVELTLSADPDVYAYWHQGQYPDGLNYGSINDRRISEVLEKARADANGINRSMLYHQFQELFAERAIALPLYYPLYTYAVTQNVEGIQLGFIGSPEDRFRTLAMWQFTQD